MNWRNNLCYLEGISAFKQNSKTCKSCDQILFFTNSQFHCIYPIFSSLFFSSLPCVSFSFVFPKCTCAQIQEVAISTEPYERKELGCLKEDIFQKLTTATVSSLISYLGQDERLAHCMFMAQFCPTACMHKDELRVSLKMVSWGDE